MSEQNQNVQTNSDNGLLSKRFKFMTNILRESKHRTKYIKSLEKFTIDAMVSFIRIFMSIGLFVFLTVFYLGYAFGDTARLPWIIAQATGIYIGGCIIILYYMISSRDQSMLNSIFVLIYSLIDETGRRRTGLAGNPKTVGIDYIDDRKNCLIHLDNGRVAKAIKVEGNLSKSVLPQVADDTADAVKSYLISLFYHSNAFLRCTLHSRVQTYRYLDLHISSNIHLVIILRDKVHVQLSLNS